MQVLRPQQLVQVLFKGNPAARNVDIEGCDNSHEDLLETLEVPILVDDCVDNSREEDLLSFVGEEVHETVHLVDCLAVSDVFHAPLRQKLLTNQEDEVSDVGIVGEVHVLSWVLEAYLHLVHQGAAHGSNHGMDFGIRALHY